MLMHLCFSWCFPLLKTVYLIGHRDTSHCPYTYIYIYIWRGPNRAETRVYVDFIPCKNPLLITLLGSGLLRKVFSFLWRVVPWPQVRPTNSSSFELNKLFFGYRYYIKQILLIDFVSIHMEVTATAKGYSPGSSRQQWNTPQRKLKLQN